jgi:hypothetical protein
MSRPDQLDMFAAEPPPPRKLHKNEISPGVFAADPVEVRAKLLAVLAELKAAETMPWDARRALYWRTVFPQMTNWLPPDEAARMRDEFAAELARVG